MTSCSMSGLTVIRFPAAQATTKRQRGQGSLNGPCSRCSGDTLLKDCYQCNNSKCTNKENTNLHWNSGVFVVVSISMPAHVLSSIFVF